MKSHFFKHEYFTREKDVSYKCRPNRPTGRRKAIIWNNADSGFSARLAII